MEYAVEAANELLNLPVLPDSGRIVPIRNIDIVLQDVSFSYKVNSGKAGGEGGPGRDGTGQNEVLHDISLKMPQGSFTSLVGPSGGGKSTVARLIARFWDVTGGSISIGRYEYQGTFHPAAFRIGQFRDTGQFPVQLLSQREHPPG